MLIQNSRPASSIKFDFSLFHSVSIQRTRGKDCLITHLQIRESSYRPASRSEQLAALVLKWRLTGGAHGSGVCQEWRSPATSFTLPQARIPLLQNGSSLTPALQLGSGAPLGNGTEVSSLGGQGGGESQEVGQSLQPAEVAKHGRASVAQVILAGR